ncbi:hypothetical protein DSECCO2_426190 [anaerobic digester metagenome]
MAPSPNCHAHEVGRFSDASVNVTFRGATPMPPVVLLVNAATGAVASMTVIGLVVVAV